MLILVYIVNCSGGSATFLFDQRHDQIWESSKNAIDHIISLTKNANYITLRLNNKQNNVRVPIYYIALTMRYRHIYDTIVL